MRNGFKGTVLIALVLLVQGCGFALRGKQASLSHIVPEVQLAVENHAFENLLQSSLASADVSVVEDKAPIFEVLSATLDRIPEAYGDDGQIRRERVQGELTFQLSDTSGEVLLPAERVHAQRDQYHYSAHDLANASESERLDAEVRRDLVNQALWHLRALSNTEAP